MAEIELAEFTEKREAGIRALIRDSALDDLVSVDLMVPERFLARCEDTEYAGRVRPMRIVLPSGTRAIVRQYRRGGVAGRFLGGTYASGNRMFEEAVVSEHLIGCKVPTTRVLAAVRISGRGIGYSGLLITEELKETLPLRQIVPQGQDGRRILLNEVPAAVRVMHDAGVAHHDLTVDNILVKEKEIFIVDFDGCSVADNVGSDRRMSDLMRFRRSAHKNSLAVGREEWKIFMENYAAGDEDISGRIDKWLSLFDKRLFWYRLGWKLGV